MQDMLTEFEYELTSQFDVMINGQMEPAISITLKAPSSKNLTECGILKQAFFRALPDTEDVEDSDANIDDMKGEDILILISMSSDVSLSDVLITAKKLFSSKGIAQINGSTTLTSPLADKLSIDDLEGMLGQYLVNFILASSLKRMKEKQLEVLQT